MLRRLAISVFVVSSTFCQAQFRTIPGEADADGCSTKSPARLCMGTMANKHCYSPKSNKDEFFGLEPKAIQVGRFNDVPLILFSASFSGCGTGTLTDFSILTVKAGAFVDLLPEVRLTNQSEHKFWDLPRISKLPTLVTADFIWDYEAMQKSNFQEETHLAAHRYKVKAFVFNPTRGKYIKRVDYETKKKYPGLDEADEINVLDAEKPTILVKLRQKPA